MHDPKFIPKVIFLSSTSLGEVMLAFLRTLPCDIVFADTTNQRLRSFPSYDIGLSFLHTHRIPPTESGKNYRWINFHPGPLPEMRGRNLAYNAIMNCCENFGASIHYMDESFDTGEIIETARFPVQEYHTAGDLVALSHSVLSGFFLKYVPLILRGKIPSQVQSEGTYYSKRPVNDLVTLTEEQRRLIRAITVAPKFYPKIRIANREFLVRLEDDCT